MDAPVPAARCRGLFKSFGAGETRQTVLNGVDLDVAAGTMSFVVGPSGCGKTTLISIIPGLLTADRGTVHLFGTDISTLGARDLVEFRGRYIGFVFQQFNLLTALDAAENVAVPLIAQGMRTRPARQRALEFLERLGMAAHAAKRPFQLSGGQQQRVSVARSLVHDPRLVICDEPTASLDAASGQAVMGLLRDVAVRPGRAVIVVTHDERILPYADRFAMMSDGRITDIVDTPHVEAA